MDLVVMALWGAVLGAGVALVLLLVFLTWRPPAPRQRAASTTGTRIVQRLDRFTLRVVLAAVSGIGIAALSGWPAAALLAAIGGATAPSMFGGRRKRARSIEMLDALAVWSEQLASQLRAWGGIEDALRATRSTAPTLLAEDVARLVDDIDTRRRPLRAALAAFTDRVDHPTASIIVVALQYGSDTPGRLPDVLEERARTARRETAMRREVEADREGVYLTVQATIAVVAGICVWFMVAQRTYVEPFGSVVGQIVLLAIGAAFFGCVVWLNRAATPKEPAPVLTGQYVTTEELLR